MLDYFYGYFSAISVGQCLLVISEDNAVAWRILAEYTTVFQNLLKIEGDFKADILRTVVAGIITNVPVLSIQNSSLVLEALNKTIEINHRNVLNELTSRLPLNEEQEAPQVEIMDDDMNVETEREASTRRLREDLPSEIERDIKNVGYLLSAQRIAAEVLTNICSSEDSEMNEDIDDDLSDAESVHDYDTAEHQNGTQLSADKISVEISEAVKGLKIVEKVMKLFLKFDSY